MIKNLAFTATLAALTTLPMTGLADHHESNRWEITLNQLEPLSDDERMFVLDVLGIDLTLDQINQAIAEGDIPLSAFGGE